MAKYNFKLEPVRRLRASHRDTLRGQLADAFEAARKLEAESKKLETELKELSHFRRQASAEKDFQVSRLLDSQRYEAQLKIDQRELLEKIKLVDQEIERRRTLVVNAEREVRVLDVLDERGREEHRRTGERREQNELDETASVVWGRSSNR